VYAARHFYFSQPARLDRFIADENQHHGLIRKDCPTTRTGLPGVSILKPLCGVDAYLKTNLETFFNIEYPGKYELLFCIGQRGDRSEELVKELMENYPSVDASVFVGGGEKVGSNNPKIDNISPGYVYSALQETVCLFFFLRFPRVWSQSCIHSIHTDACKHTIHMKYTVCFYAHHIPTTYVQC
jgi:hypothetical protein